MVYERGKAEELVLCGDDNLLSIKEVNDIGHLRL